MRAGWPEHYLRRPWQALQKQQKASDIHHVPGTARSSSVIALQTLLDALECQSGWLALAVRARLVCVCADKNVGYQAALAVDKTP